MKPYIPALACALLILWGSVWPNDAFPTGWSELFSRDKVLHAAAYFTLMVLAGWGWHRGGSRAQFGLGLVLAAVIGYGICLEIMQFALSTGRRFEIFDILANCVGALLGHAIFHFFIK